MVRLLLLTIIFVLLGCAPPTEEAYPPKWVVASIYLPREKIQGLRPAGFFEIKNTIYSHHCDNAGNMIRLKFDEENRIWKQVRYETHGCIDNTL